MANGVITLGSTKANLEGRIVWESASNGSSANNSYVAGHLQVRRNDNYTTKGTWTGALRVGGEVHSFSNASTSVGSDWVTMIEFYIYHPHNDDGTGSCFIEGYCNGPSGTSMAGHSVSGNQWVTLDTIPRYAAITSFSVKSKSLNTVTLQFTTDVGVDFAQYAQEGFGFVNLDSSNTIFNLTPNTTYKFKIRVRRTDSQLWTESGYVTVTTYDIAKITEAPNINIGESHTVKWSNPGGAETALKLCDVNGNTIVNFDEVTGNSKEITPNAEMIYALTPNSNTFTARYVITSLQNGTSYTSYKDFTFSVVNSNPEFSNFTFVDSNEETVALTGNNQKLIKYYSNVKATISVANKAIAKNSATMKKYRLVVGSKQSDIEYSDSAAVDLEVKNIENNNITVYAIDSRENSTSKTLTPEQYIEYSKIAISSVLVSRGDGGVGTTTTLKYTGKFWNDTFGSVKNIIENIKYYYKVAGSAESEWKEGKTQLTPVISGNDFSQTIEIQGDLAGEGFAQAYAFDIKVIVADKLSENENSAILGNGTPLVAYHKNGVSIGQKYNVALGGLLQVGGKRVESMGGGGLDTLPIGAVVEWFSHEIPDGWLLCDGSEISRTQYATLFKVLGVTSGEGNGSTTFNLPDMRMRVPVGYLKDDDWFGTLGDYVVNSKTQALRALVGATHASPNRIGYSAAARVPGHSYAYSLGTSDVITGVPEGDINHSTMVTDSNGNTPTTVQPSIVCNYIIKALYQAEGSSYMIDYDALPAGTIIDFDGDIIPDGYEEIENYDDYSLGDILTNKTWINGKPIYRRIIQDTTIHSSGAYDVSGVPSGLEDVVSFICFAYQNSTNKTIFIGSTSPFDSDNKFSVYLNGTTLSIRSSWEIKKIIMIIEYTKTTD